MYTYRFYKKPIEPSGEEFTCADVNAFLREYQHLFTQKHREIIFDLLLILDTDGRIPSVVMYPGRRSVDPALLKLSKIPLVYHSVNVARLVIKQMQRIDYSSRKCLSLLACDAVIAALAHDIGKIRRFRDDRYTSQVHVDAGCNVVMCLIDGRLNDVELAYINSAIRNHHSQSKEPGPLDDVIKQADEYARVLEHTLPDLTIFDGVISRQEKHVEPFEDFRGDIAPLENCPTWFDLEEFLVTVKRTIHNPFLGQQAFELSFTFGDNLFISPNAIKRIAAEIAYVKADFAGLAVIDHTRPFRSLLAWISKQLDFAGYRDNSWLRPAHDFRSFWIYCNHSSGPIKRQLIPLKKRELGIGEEYEKLKLGSVYSRIRYMGKRNDDY